MSNIWHSWLLAPVHATALATAAKSFRDNPFPGSPVLDRAGLHVTTWERHFSSVQPLPDVAAV